MNVTDRKLQKSSYESGEHFHRSFTSYRVNGKSKSQSSFTNVLTQAFQECLLKIDKAEVKINKNSVNILYSNTNPNKTLINISWFPTKDKVALKIFLSLKVSIAENERDHNYGRTLMKTTFDLCRIIEVQSTFIAKVMMENFQKSTKFEPKFSVFLFTNPKM
jgi:hypothetical protein